MNYLVPGGGGKIRDPGNEVESKRGRHGKISFTIFCCVYEIKRPEAFFRPCRLCKLKNKKNKKTKRNEKVFTKARCFSLNINSTFVEINGILTEKKIQLSLVF